MNVMSSSSELAVRQPGVCRGTLWRQRGSSASSRSSSGSGLSLMGGGTSSSSSSSSSTDAKTCNYCVLTGVKFVCYESPLAYQRGDLPVACLAIVGASAWKPTTKARSSSSSPSTSDPYYDDASFRIVSDKGTHFYCQAPTATCRDAWLTALYAGLEQSLLRGSSSSSPAAITRQQKRKIRLPSPLSTGGSGGASAGGPSLIQRSFQMRQSKSKRKTCTSCGVEEGTTASSSSSSTPTSASARTQLTESSPLPHLGHEGRVLLCGACENSQGLLLHMEFVRDCLESQRQERQALVQARRLVWETVASAGPPPPAEDRRREEEAKGEPVPAGRSGSPAAAAAAKVAEDGTTEGESSEPQQQQAGEQSHEDDDHDHGNDQSSGESSESWTHVDNNSSGGSGGSGGSGASKTSPLAGSWHAVDRPPDSEHQQWIHLPPTKASTKALLNLLQNDAAYAGLTRASLTLDSLSREVLGGEIGVGDFMEQLDEAALVREDGEAGGCGGCGSISPSGGCSLARQAFVLKKQAFRVAGDMGTALKLLVDHALPPAQREKLDTTTEMLGCILDFFLDLCEEGDLSSVALFWQQFCHIHLRMLPPENATALARVELVEDFLLTVASRYSIHLGLELAWSHTADLEESMGASSSSSTCAVSCRRRRFAVLRFVCELESLLFDLDDCWGGGSASLGKMVSPKGDHVALLRSTIRDMQELRKSSPIRLARSSRLDRVTRSRQSTPPEEAVEEKLRIAKNAEYFTSHLDFTRRICDIAEKLRFMEVEDRAGALEGDLNLLNASGTLGGDPLNNVQDDLVRVVRVPSTEGHVFRSKERTPVLLLMEVIHEGAEPEPAIEKSPFSDERRAEGKPKASSRQEASREAAVDSKPTCCEEAKDGTGDTEKGEEIVPAMQGDDALDETEQRAREAVRQTLQQHEAGPPASPPGAPKPPAPPLPPLPPSHRARLSSVEGVLEGATEGIKPSPRPAGLKRFDGEGDELETPSTPKHDVELLVSSVMEQQIKMSDICLPDLVQTQKPAEIPGKNPILLGESASKSSDYSLDQMKVVGKETETKKSPQSDDIFRTKQEAACLPQNIPSSIETTSSRDSLERRNLKKKSTLGNLAGTSGEGSTPTGEDARRAVLNALMVKGMQGDTIAAGTADSVQRSLQELERKKATELLLSGSYKEAQTAGTGTEPAYAEIETTRQKLVSLGFGSLNPNGEASRATTEDDEVMEAIRLLLIQNRVAQGHLSEADAAKVLQHSSLKRTHSDIQLSSESRGGRSIDPSELPTIDAGDVDRRLVGCGPLPPAILQALTLWKGEMVSNAELLELVKKDLEFLRHNILHEAENVEKLNEDSAFWGRFAFGERWAEKKARIAATSPDGYHPGWDLLGVIVKSNDDLRQETFIMQLIRLCQEAFELAGLDLWVSPYRIIATGRTTGVIEMVRNSMSFDALKKRPGYGKGGLREHLQRMTEFTADPGGAFKSAQQNFVRSLAAYSLMSYFFLFKDRHNGNILLDTAGHLCHIDFGFVMGIAPGGSFSLEMSTPFKLTEDMINVMGGLTSPLFSEFVTLFCCGFLAIQSHAGTFLTVVEIMCKDSTFKCFEGRDADDIMTKLRERFCLDRTKEETVAFALDLIKQATTSYGTRQYDMFQYLSQGIAS